MPAAQDEPGVGGFVPKTFLANLGHSNPSTPLPVTPLAGWKYPEIPEGVQTTLLLVPFPVTTTGVPQPKILFEDGELAMILGLCILIWILPVFCINKRLCPGQCLRRWCSRRIAWYFIFATIFNIAVVSVAIAFEPDISANQLFFQLVAMLEKFSEEFEKVLAKAVALVGLLVAYLFRKRVIALLGFDSQLVRADLRDILTCFTMSRFSVIEVSILKIENLPASGFTTRTLFARVLSGYNEPQHSRPHDGCSTKCSMKERLQLNYDREDNSQKFSIVIKQQELVAGAVSQMAPIVGALAGGGGGLVTPLGPTGGAVAGMVAGIGAANSLGKEVARVDMSSDMVNRFLDKDGKLEQGMTSVGAGSWIEDEFTKVHMVPQGTMWLRIREIEKE